MRFMCYLLCVIFFTVVAAPKSCAYVVKTYPQNNYTYGSSNIYSKNLSAVERYLFGRAYTAQTTSNRLSRIEKELFNTTYNTMNMAQRMNNVLANYQAAGKTYCQAPSFKQRLINSLIGQPTGYTPPIYSPYINTYGPSYTRGFYGNNGWRTHNIYNPIVTGSGINILR